MLHVFENYIKKSKVSDGILVMFHCRDAREIFLEKESVDLFFTHPPYHGNGEAIAEYGNFDLQVANADSAGYLNNLISIMKHMEYALKPTGSIIVGIPAKPLLYYFIKSVLEETGLVPHAPIIWEYGNLPEYKQYNKTQVYFLHFSKGSPEYRELEDLVIDIPWGNDVDLANVKGHANDALPIGICDIIVEHFTKENDVVADLMAGTGSLAYSCVKNKRNFIYNDVSEEQLNIAKERIEKIQPLRGNSMNREELVEMMANIAETNNLEAMQSASLPDDQIKQMTEQVRPQLLKIQGQIYDALVSEGIINA